MAIRDRTDEEGWVMMDTLMALLLSAALLGAIGTLLVRTADSALHLSRGASDLIQLRNGIGAPREGPDDPL